MRVPIMLTLMASALLGGCTHAVSPALLDMADRDLSFAELRQQPQANQGKIVVLGGVIVQVLHSEEGSLLEVYQTRTNHLGEPVDLDRSGGRFMVLHPAVLEPGIYRKGRRVTVAGRVIGEMIGDLGNLEYRYPYLAALEIRLWEERPQPRHDPFHDPFYGPFYSPYWDPWYGRYRRHPTLFPYRRHPFYSPWW
ncbi:outer membrane lipoprotein [Desulfonatronum thiosulfatophilum]|uniref:Outer membrane lipoprotein n=1 Tax=Desulfonatronum thiosulfatophilum TaxID=617002 RepID=A0A1G6BB92_9BACT|nr:Slp/YeaY family lipoprotein [Desulfonatronum thiosulfatophilum]SDB17850.1 outer membrane lipoprotein [Desulfonatronum thiosulfatophilum]